MNNKRKIAVLIGTYNGSQYIRKQLDSIVSQTFSDWVIYASDDGSTDNTLDILKEYQARVGAEKFNIICGPGEGFAWNFISLLEQSGNGFAWYAFCDQDDEWMPEKLEKGISFFSGQCESTPAVYCGRTLLVDENNKILGKSPLFKKNPSFKNALIQSIAGGNTMIINQAGRSLIVKTPKDTKIVSHDWWVYILITAAGGEVYYDPTPTILYRQHTGNIVGSNKGWLARVQRIMGLLDGHFKDWIDMNLLALKKTDIVMTKESQIILNRFLIARSSGFYKRIHTFRKIGMYRQTLFGTLGLYFAVLLRKI